MTATTSTAVSSAPRAGLRSPSLPRGAVGALAVGVAAVTAVLVAVTPLAGRTATLIVFALLLLVVQTAVSRAVEGRRKATDRLVTTSVVLAFVLALLPLFSVLAYTASRGIHRFDVDFFYRSQRSIGARDPGGGAYHALLGTLEQVGIATLIAVPFGLLVAVYVVEYGRGRLAATIRFFVDVMTGIPSIVAGLFVLSSWILGLGMGFSGFAAALALTVLMLPIIVRSAEEMLRLVPSSLREASLALGVPRWKTILRIVLPTALPGIVTGVMLAVARVMGETAPVLLTAFGAASIVRDPFGGGPQSSLPLFIYQQAGDAQQTAVDRAWTAALTLILLVMALNLLARLVTRRSTIGR
ncbi:MAG: phosphate transporter, inner rane subunit PstA [Frankiales bacterium]|nr:phosphate transporter, inner rane subunit PstA [Frankiales bacterium]